MQTPQSRSGCRVAASGSAGRRSSARDIARAVLQGAVGRSEEEELARALRFRTAALRRSSEESLTAAVRSGLVRLAARPFLDLLVQVHFSSRAEVLSRTYDLLGVEHAGIEVEDPVLNAPLDEGQVRAAFSGVASSSDSVRLELCLVVMSHLRPPGRRESPPPSTPCATPETPRTER